MHAAVYMAQADAAQADLIRDFGSDGLQCWRERRSGGRASFNAQVLAYTAWAFASVRRLDARCGAGCIIGA